MGGLRGGGWGIQVGRKLQNVQLLEMLVMPMEEVLGRVGRSGMSLISS